MTNSISKQAFWRCAVCLSPSSKPHEARLKTTGEKIVLCPKCYARISAERAAAGDGTK